MIPEGFEFYGYLDEETLHWFRKMIVIQEPGTDVQIRFHFGTQYDYNDVVDDDDWEINIHEDSSDRFYCVGNTLKDACEKYFIERIKRGL